MISKIKNQADAEKKRKRNQLLLGAGLIFLMLASTAGFAFLGGHDGAGQQNTHGGALQGATLTEKGLTFSRNEPYWVTNIQGQQAIFQYLPTEVEDIEVRGLHGLHQYSGNVLYFVGSQEGAAEIVSNLHPYVLRYQEACHESINDCDENLPVKTCADRVFIYLQGDEGQDSVHKQENCVYLTGDPIKTSDAFLYTLFEVNEQQL